MLGEGFLLLRAPVLRSAVGGLKLIKNLFKGAILEAVLLNLINSAPQGGLHGYTILSNVRKKFGVYLGSSTLYPELKHLEEQGLITSAWDITDGKARKKYKMTKKGQNVLTDYSNELKVFIPSLLN